MIHPERGLATGGTRPPQHRPAPADFARKTLDFGRPIPSGRSAQPSEGNTAATARATHGAGAKGLVTWHVNVSRSAVDDGQDFLQVQP